MPLSSLRLAVGRDFETFPARAAARRVVRGGESGAQRELRVLAVAQAQHAAADDDRGVVRDLPDPDLNNETTES